MTACCVPFCRGRSRTPYGEWICSRHWRLVSRDLRRTYGRAWRVDARLGPYWEKPAGSPERFAAVDAHREVGRLWEVCKTEAIEAGVGIR